MPKYFHFKTTNNSVFTKQLSSKRCGGITRSNARCRRKSVIGTEKCWMHKKSEDKLRIKPATDVNMGSGLFATNGTNNDAIVFRDGQHIIDYNGEILNDNQLNNRYGEYTAPYAVRKNATRIHDCASDRCTAGLINRKSYSTANCKFVNPRNSNRIRIEAKRNIRNNKELFISYGDGQGDEAYVMEHHTRSRTNNRKKW